MSSVEVLAPTGFSQQDDTQVAPTQEIQSFHENSRSSKLRQSESGDFVEHDDHNHTYQTGDTGHINLAEDEDGIEGTLKYTGNDESQNTHTQTQTQVEMTVTSPASPSFVTKNHAGHKRDIRGNFVNYQQHIWSPQPRTPASNLVALFDFGKPSTEVDLSGLFGQTQANQTPAAPLADVFGFSRPSPGEAQSQLQDQSSPIKAQDDTAHAAKESRNAYVSMRESQDNRRKRRQSEEARSSSPIDAFDEDDELGDDSIQLKMEKKLQKAKVEQEANEKFAALGSSSKKNVPSGLHGRGRSMSGAIDLITPATVRQKTDTIYISDDIRVEEEDLGDAAISSDAESVDQFDEFSQAVIASDGVDENVLGPTPNNRRNGRSRSAAKTVSPVRRSLLPPPVLSHSRRTFHAMPVTQRQGSYSLHSHSQARINVPNSQPDSTLNQGSNSIIARPPRPIMPSSINSQGFISESQSLGLTISSGRQEFSNFTMPQESIVSSIPIPPVLRDTSSQTSKTGEEGDEEPHQQREDSPDSSPPPQVPESSKHEATAPEASLPKNSLVEEDMPDADETHELEVAPQDDVDELDPESVGLAALTSKIGHSTSLAMIPDSDDTRSRLSNRKRHQIQDSSQPASTAGDTRSAPSHQYISAPAQQDDEHEEGPVTNEAPPGSRVSNGANKNTESFYCTAPDSTTPLKPQSSAAARMSPPQSRPMLKMSEIAMQASPEQSSAEVDFCKINVLNEEDDMFRAIVSPPRKKIRRHYGRNALPISPQAAKTSSILSSPPPTSPPVRKSVRIARHRSPNLKPATVTPDAEESPNVGNGKLKRLRSGLRRSGANEPSSTAKSVARFEIQETPQSGDVQPPPSPDPVVAEDIDDEDPLSKDVPATVTEDAPILEGDVTMADVPNLPSSDAALVVPDRVSTPNPAENLTVPDRVLARFNGSSSMAFYPATCLGPVKPGASVQKVRFDDGTITELEAHLVRRFELQPGELVRVDLPDKKKKTWMVKGFLNRVDTVETQSKENVVTDVNGFTTVRLEEKARKSLPAAGQLPELETIDVDFSDIYLTLQMWNQLKGRSYKHARAVVSSARLTTPFNMITAPATPSSRTRRKTMGDVVPPSRTISLKSEAHTGLFTDMAFAITYAADRDSYRSRVSRLILSNGGSILSDGFDELFEPTSPPPLSPTKSPALDNAMLNMKLKLTSEAWKLGFTALIADTHCRKAKYMQALALNIPCLSGRWIVDSIEAGKLLDWTKYLLPAGESAFLHGAVRSRTFSEIQLAVNAPISARLPTIVEKRCKLAENKNIILVTGTSKVAEEKRRPYLFLMCALGASKIQKVKDLIAAKTLLEKGRDKWDWIYVDDTKVAKVKERLGLGAPALLASGVRKRKRGLEDEHEVESTAGSGCKTRVVDDEFVVQSLILGALVE